MQKCRDFDFYILIKKTEYHDIFSEEERFLYIE